MNYYYDIFVSMDDHPKAFYEWEDIEHIKKLPIFKLDKKEFKDLMLYKIKISKNILSLIYNKTKLYSNIENTINYMALFTDGIDSIVIEFNSSGESIYKSYLDIEEQLHVEDISYNLILTNIDYSIIKRDYSHSRYLVKEVSIKNYLLKEITYLKNNMLIDKLMFLNYQYFNRITSDINEIYNNFYKEINENFNDNLLELYNTLKNNV